MKKGFVAFAAGYMLASTIDIGIVVAAFAGGAGFVGLMVAMFR